MNDYRTLILWLNALLIALTTTAIGSRVGRRAIVIGKWSWNDALITLAAVSATIFSIFQMVATNYGLGRHMVDVNPAQMPTLVKLVMASNVFYFLCNWAVKHSLLLFYSEIVRENRAYRISIYIMHFVAFGFGLSSILVNLFQCRPFNKAWRGDEVKGYCVNLNIFFLFNAPIMLATDLVLYIMPVVFTWHLQLRRPQRVGLNCLFGLGGFVLAASAVRVESVYQFASKPDFPWRFANAMIWSVIENHLAIVVACAPSVKVIALLVFPRLASSLHSLVSKVTPSTSMRSRSRSRASLPFSADLESGTVKSSKSASAQSGKLRPTPVSTPLPSPAFTKGSGMSSPTGSRTERASSAFAKWVKGPQSPGGLGSGDSMEDHGLVYMEDLSSLGKDVQVEHRDGENDIRVQHDISVESMRESSEV